MSAVQATSRPLRRPYRWAALLGLVAGASLPPVGSSAKSCPGGPLRVAVDVGHSKAMPGATSATGKTEYVFNKRFVDELVDRSRTWQGIDLFVVSGANPGLLDRPHQAAMKGADLFLSIHHDSVQKKYLQRWQHEGRWLDYSDAFKGYSLFVWDRGPHVKESMAVATLIGRNLKAAGFVATLHHAEPIAGENRPLLDRDLGIYAAPFAVLRFAQLPAVLWEVGIIVNRSEERELEDPKVRATMQLQFLRALQAYCTRRTHPEKGTAR
jgi:N-acetylmuramoyl-L-alanine amidase